MNVFRSQTHNRRDRVYSVATKQKKKKIQENKSRRQHTGKKSNKIRRKRRERKVKKRQQMKTLKRREEMNKRTQTTSRVFDFFFFFVALFFFLFNQVPFYFGLAVAFTLAWNILCTRCQHIACAFTCAFTATVSPRANKMKTVDDAFVQTFDSNWKFSWRKNKNT